MKYFPITLKKAGVYTARVTGLGPPLAGLRNVAFVFGNSEDCAAVIAGEAIDEALAGAWKSVQDNITAMFDRLDHFDTDGSDDGIYRSAEEEPQDLHRRIGDCRDPRADAE